MTALAVTSCIILLVVLVGFLAGRDKVSRSSIEEWSVGGRRLGAFFVWFLVGADTYTAATFLGITGYAYNYGAPAFYAIAYLTLAYPVGYFILPKLWRYAAKYNLTTLADYARERFQSKFVGVLIAITSIVFLVPYIDLQLSGITGVVKVAGQGVFKHTGAIGVTALILSFALVAFYTFFSGLRAPAWTSVVKDLLVWIVMIVMMLTIPFIWFHGWGDMLSQAVARFPKMMTLPGNSPHGSMGSLWYGSTALMTALALFLWPHSSTGALSSKSEDALRKNTVFLPFYNILVFFLTWLGVVALLVLPHHANDPSYANFVILYLIKASYHNQFLQGIMYATIALASLVPASVMVLSASNLFASNILKDWLAPNMSTRKVMLTGRSFVFIITAVALLFGVVFPNYITQLQMEGTSGMVQILPVIVLSLYWKRLSKVAVSVGLICGITMVFLNHFVLHWPGYDGFWGLVVNLIVVIGLNVVGNTDADRNIIVSDKIVPK